MQMQVDNTTRALTQARREAARAKRAEDRALDALALMTRELAASRGEAAYWKAVAMKSHATVPPRSVSALATELGMTRHQALSRFLHSTSDRRPLESKRVRDALTKWWLQHSTATDHELAILDDRSFASAFLASGLCAPHRRAR